MDNLQNRTRSSETGVGDDTPKAGETTTGRGGEAASTRLDKWTNYVQPSWNGKRPAWRVVFRDYGHGHVEATVTINRPRRPRLRVIDKVTAPDTAGEPSIENLHRAVGRACTTIRRTMMAAKLDHLLTLTYRENMQDRKRAWDDFSRFVRFVRKYSKDGFWPYVAVQELQQRGAIHIHAAVHGFQNVGLLRHAWHEAIGGEEKGNIDIKHFKGHLPILASYMTKYISKDFEHGLAKGIHRYKRSRGIQLPIKIYNFDHSAAIDHELILLFEKYGVDLKFHKNMLNQKGAKWLWACSW